MFFKQKGQICILKAFSHYDIKNGVYRGKGGIREIITGKQKGDGGVLMKKYLEYNQINNDELGKREV